MTGAIARRLCSALDVAKDLFGADLIVAPAVEILLCVHAAETEGRRLMSDDLARHLRMSEALTNRWLRLLVSRQLLSASRSEHAADTTYRISPRCAVELTHLLSDIVLV
jgi:hypothetical protein